jgi:hypothetical protein
MGKQMIISPLVCQPARLLSLGAVMLLWILAPARSQLYFKPLSLTNRLSLISMSSNTLTILCWQIS